MLLLCNSVSTCNLITYSFVLSHRYATASCGLELSTLALIGTTRVVWTYVWYSITHSLFHSRLKSSLPHPFLFLIQVSLYGFPRLFTVTSEHIRLFTFQFFFCFYTFLVVGSVRQIKLTCVGFRAHVKIACRIVFKSQQTASSEIASNSLKACKGNCGPGGK